MAATLIAPPGVLPAARGRRVLSRRALAVAAAVALMLAVGGVAVFERLVATASTAFPRDPDLKRAHSLVTARDAIFADLTLAEDIVKPVLAARPNDPEVVTVAAEVAQAFLDSGFDATQPRRAAAQKLTERAVQLAPENPEALAALGSYLRFTRSQLARADELVRAAIARNPKESRYHRALYSILEVTKPAEAEAFGTQMAASFPQDPLVAYDIARHSMASLNLPLAEEWLDKSLTIGPVVKAIVWKAQFMLQVHGDADGMKSWLDRVPDRARTTANTVNAFAVHAMVTGRTADAQRLLDSIQDTWLNDGTYIFPKALLAGDLAQVDGQTDVARIQYEAALKDVQTMHAADPTDLRLIRAELWIEIGLGNADAARQALRINMEKAPRPYRWRLDMVWWSGALRADFLLGEREQGLALLKEAAALPQGRLLLRNLIHADPKMARFRDDPEVVALLAEAKTEGVAVPGRK